MEEINSITLESALAGSAAAAENTLKAAQMVNQALKKYARVLKEGNLKEIGPAMNEVEKAEMALRQQIAVAKEGWNFDVEGYLNSGSYVKEVLALAAQKGVPVFERADRLYSYPVLVRVLPAEKAVLIDKAKEKRLRPSLLISRLKDLQKKPPRFRPEAFLEALHEAYQKALQIQGSRDKNQLDSGETVSLLEVYELFTLLPGQTREYSRQEFARDIYLLDRSGVCDTKNKSRLSLPASSGNKINSRTLSVFNEFGEEKRYYGLAFTAQEQ